MLTPGPLDPPANDHEMGIRALERQRWRRADRADLAAHQLQRLQQLLDVTQAENAFYRERYGHKSVQVRTLEDLRELPLLSKADLVPTDGDLAPHHSWPRERYQRMHRTSGTRGRPLVILDTKADWQWWIDTWQYVLDAAEVTSHDRAFMAFSSDPLSVSGPVSMHLPRAAPC